MQDNDFQLRNDPEPTRKRSEPPDPKLTQLKLFSGLDCLPDQLDLFQVDGYHTGGRECRS